MSRVSNALNMLALLKSRGKMTRNEIANELECDKREVSRYKDDLLMAGVRIKEIRGKNGGYLLEGKDYLLSLDFNDSEYLALNMGLNELKRIEEFLLIEDFKKALIKINSLKDKSMEVGDPEYYIKKVTSYFDYEQERKVWLDINAAIITRNKLLLMYDSTKGTEERVVRPYALYQYKGDMYFVGFCELRQAVRQFKLSRIKNYKKLEEKFIMNEQFNLDNYLNGSFGIYKDSEIDLKLKIQYPLAQVIKEKQWYKDELVEDYKEEGYIIYKAKMFGETEIMSWILSMGMSAEVLEPKEFREKIQNELKKTLEIYK